MANCCVEAERTLEYRVVNNRDASVLNLIEDYIDDLEADEAVASSDKTAKGRGLAALGF